MEHGRVRGGGEEILPAGLPSSGGARPGVVRSLRAPPRKLPRRQEAAPSHRRELHPQRKARGHPKLGLGGTLLNAGGGTLLNVQLDLGMSPLECPRRSAEPPAS